jgi:hypothetical protein
MSDVVREWLFMVSWKECLLGHRSNICLELLLKITKNWWPIRDSKELLFDYKSGQFLLLKRVQ